MEIQEIFDCLLNTKQAIKALEEQQLIFENMIHEYFNKTKEKKYSNGFYSVQPIKSTRINYDVDKMKSVLDKGTFRKITDREITVDESALHEIIEENPEIKKLIKNALCFKYSVNKKKLEKVFTDNLISEDELMQFADVSISEYLKITENKKAETDE